MSAHGSSEFGVPRRWKHAAFRDGMGVAGGDHVLSKYSWATRDCSPELMLTLLVVLSLVKAALIVSYFMHLKYEKIGLTLLLIPSTIFCICMIIIFFMPDGCAADADAHGTLERAKRP